MNNVKVRYFFPWKYYYLDTVSHTNTHTHTHTHTHTYIYIYIYALCVLRSHVLSMELIKPMQRILIGRANTETRIWGLIPTQ